MATNKPQSSVSATELAQALTEALQKNRRRSAWQASYRLTQKRLRQ